MDAPLDDPTGDGECISISRSEYEQALREAASNGAFKMLERLNLNGGDTLPSDKEIGRRAIFIYHRLCPGRTNGELAQQLGVSHQRVAQLLEAYDAKKSNVYTDKTRHDESSP